MDNKYYKITLFGQNGVQSNFVGVGAPNTTNSEILIKSPDGKEVILFRENFQGFYVEEVELKHEQSEVTEEDVV